FHHFIHACRISALLGQALVLLGQGKSGVRSSAACETVLKTPQLATINPGFVDRLIHADYQRAGHAMLTCETAAKKLDNVEVVSDFISPIG
ncbi:MAG: hypothetical protein WCO42_04795, partial [bacterium]